MKYTLCLSVALVLLVKLTGADDTVTPNPLCPYPSEDFTRFPYQGDCTKYWECYEGQRYPMTCPDGFEYNSETGVCDFPELANCDSDATVTYPTFPHTTSTPGTGPTTPTTTVWTPDPICPYPSSEMTYVVHPYNCSLYYECYQGIKYLMACPSPLVFNIDAKYCDYQENVDCSRTSTTVNTTPGPDVTTNEPPSSTTTTPGSSTTPGSTTTPDNVCANMPDGTFLSDPSDCSKFYECLYGKTIEGTCPLDLVWNEARLTCDYPENVTCNV